MNTRKEIDGFVAQKTLAVAGLSRNPQSFSARAYEELKTKGYTLYPVNPNAERIGGQACYATVSAVPGEVGGVLVFTPPAATEKVVREAAGAGIRRVWIQQGAQSDASIAFCKEQGLEAVSGQCILMFAEPVASFHGFHRWVKKLFGGIPRN